MTKAELINEMAAKAGLSKTDAEKALSAFTATVQETLASGEKVAMVGFGTFSLGERAARMGKNPSTGAPINIPASKSPKFKAGAALKDAVN